MTADAYGRIEFDDLRRSVFYVLYERITPNRGDIRPRERYRALVCSKCKRVDWLAALRSGVDPGVSLPTEAWNRDGLLSTDNVALITTRFRKLLESLNVGAEFFALPSGDWHAFVPGDLYYAPEEAPLINPVAPHPRGEPFADRSRHCKKCGRARYMTYWEQWFAFPPDKRLLGVVVEHWPAPGVSHYIDSETAQAMRALRLRGVAVAKVRTDVS